MKRQPAPSRGGAWLEAALLVGIALAVRAAAAWALGGGAPFGPDGTGAEAAVVLGGHPYPLHPWLIGLVGSGRRLSVLCGSLACLCLWDWGRRVGLGPGGGWLCAFLPLAAWPSALTAGDAPALLFVVAGAALSTRGRLGALAGGAVAMASVAVKPIALPAAVLLAVRPLSLAGAAAALPVAAGWLRPLWSPLPSGGLLGTWWTASGGAPPTTPSGWLQLAGGGLSTLAHAPAWTGVWLLPVAAVGALHARGPRLAVLGPILAAWAVAALFGGRMEARYLASPIIACLPWVGAVVPRLFSPVLLWPTAAVITQLAHVRAQLDPDAGVPDLPIVALPEVQARDLFDTCSTPGATAMRLRAERLAQTLPPGATLTVQRRPDGREGELVWPLRVLRPDVKIVVR